jgi:drug/metabolite transporter (DMT)-like permease
MRTSISNEKCFVILLIFAMAIWGGSWTSAKIIADSVSPAVLTFIRFFISFISFIPMLVIFKERPYIGGKSAVLTAVSSLLMVSYNILFFLGLKHGSAGAGGVLVTSINPVFTFLLSLLIFKTGISARETIGLSLGLVAGVILLGIWNIDNLFMSGNMIFLSASIVWAFLTLTVSEIQKNTSIFVYSFYMYGLSSLILFFISIPYGLTDISRMDGIFWINIVYLSVISTVFATSIFFIGSKRLSANRASSFMLLVPVFAVIISFFILGENPRISTVIGGIVAICGIYLMNGNISHEK